MVRRCVLVRLIREALDPAIVGGKLTVTAPATVREVARVAGVHPGTVSRALNPQTRHLVAERTVRRVLAAAAELGYRGNPIARGLKTQRSQTIGVLVPDLGNPVCAATVRGIEDGLREVDYVALIASTDNDPERERMAGEAMSDRRVDGFIAVAARRNHWLLADHSGPDVPVVLVNRRVENHAISVVAGDDYAGVRQAVEHLVEFGHRRIAHLDGCQALYVGRSRHRAFVEAMRIQGIQVDPRLTVFSRTFTVQEGTRCCGRLLDRSAAPTAIVAGDDLLALGCYEALEQRGLRCPEDVSIVGYNDLPFADRFRPPLTTVRIPHYELGTIAADLVLKQLRERESPARQLLLVPKLIIRNSTAAVPPRLTPD